MSGSFTTQKFTEIRLVLVRTLDRNEMPQLWSGDCWF
jgi:hypothetical protein